MRKSLLIFILIFSAAAFSQNGWTAHLGGPTGTFLSGPETCLAIDKAGNKWIGFTSSLASSPAALARYDKATGFWTYFNTTNTPVLPNNRVTAIACDTLGNLWAGTSGGLIKFDGTNWICYTTTNGLPSNNIISLECVKNMVYIGTNAGLSRYDGAIFTNYNVANGLLCNDTINCIKAESPNQIWLGHYNRIIELNINSNFTFSSFTPYQTPFTTNKVNCIYVDNSGKKWLGTASKGLVEFDNVNFNLATTTYSDIIGAYTPSVSCVDITKGPNNGALVVASCAAYPTPSGNSAFCLLELLPKQQYKTYYVSNSNYSIGDQIELDKSGTYFISNRNLVHLGNILKFMFSFDPTVYSPYEQGPGYGVNTNNFKYLDINRVKAGIANRGDMWWDIGGAGNAKYEVPKGSNAHVGFCNSLWIGGLDASNQLHLAAQSYRQTGNDFWPGPLDTTNATSDKNTHIKYDKIWKISYNDINDFITNFQNGNIANNTYTPTRDIITWPAHGTGNNSRHLAPFVDVNNNGIYDPLTGGDYPRIKGDQTLYYIFNDAQEAHSQSWGAALGVEIHCMAYAYGCPNFINGKNELAYTTFYNYRIFNRSSNNYHALRIGLYDDADLGNYADDYIGCDVQNNLGFTYNADGFDESNAGVSGYGNYPPAAGSKFLKGPLAPLNDGKDNNNNGVIDEPNEECLMNNFTTYNINVTTVPSPTTQPLTAFQYYNYISGKWRDSTNFTCGGSGYGGTVSTPFIYPYVSYPGNPCTLWSDNSNPTGDRRRIMSLGPFNLNAGQSTEFEFSQLWAVDSSSTGNILGAINKLISSAQLVNTFYKSGIQSTCLPNMAIGINEHINTIHAQIFPNPATENITIQLTENSATQIRIYDVVGRLIHSEVTNNVFQNKIDISSFQSGVYFIKIAQKEGSATLKFIKT